MQLFMFDKFRSRRLDDGFRRCGIGLTDDRVKIEFANVDRLCRFKQGVFTDARNARGSASDVFSKDLGSGCSWDACEVQANEQWRWSGNGAVVDFQGIGCAL